jgi:hypothetical protein
MDPWIAADLIKPGLAMAAGAALLWFPRQHRQNAELLHATRLAELNAGAEERYFEERRSLEAYRPAKRDLTWQLLGAVLFVLGAFRVFSIVSG